MAPIATSLGFSISPCVIPQLYLLLLSIHIGNAATQNGWTREKCKEEPTNCSATFQYGFDVQRDPVVITESYNLTWVDYFIDSSHEVCSLNLDLYNIVPAITHDLGISIYCDTLGTQVVIQGGNYTISKCTASLSITNCTIYWKDISAIDRNVDLQMLYLNDWKDEFTPMEDTCGEQQSLSTDLEKGWSELPFAEMRNIEVIHVIHTTVRQLSPVFTQHLWPNLRGLICDR